MNKHLQIVFLFSLIPAAVMLGGCLGAEPVTDTDANEHEELTEQGEPGSNHPEESANAEESGATENAPKLAAFEGQTIDISKHRGKARACLVLEEGSVECFRTEEEATARMAELDETRETTDTAGLASDPTQDLLCSSFVCLYQHSNYTGDFLCLRERRVEHNLSTWGFDNRMTSYKVGACNVTFWSGASNEGSKFVASAGTSNPNVGSTWNDRVSSIWIW